MCDCKYEVCACIVWKSKQETDNLKKKAVYLQLQYYQKKL